MQTVGRPCYAGAETTRGECMWPEGERTQELLADVRRGDDAAVNHLLERHRESLRQMVRFRMDRQLERRADASDVVQDVMLEASRRLADYLDDPKMPFHLWLRQMAKDRVIDLYRRHKVAQRRSVDREQPLAASYADRSSIDLAGMLKDPELTPAAATIRRELQRRFFDALETLGDEDREIVLMRHQEHLSNSDVAAALGLSPPAAGMRYLRALRKLRDVLREPASRS
ncbi:MAG: sigma-70 family RNA polymerase sigma factor [Planctomycetaceae bacterium]